MSAINFHRRYEPRLLNVLTGKQIYLLIETAMNSYWIDGIVGMSRFLVKTIVPPKLVEVNWDSIQPYWLNVINGSVDHRDWAIINDAIEKYCQKEVAGYGWFLYWKENGVIDSETEVDEIPELYNIWVDCLQAKNNEL